METKEPEIDLLAANLAMAAKLAGEPVDPTQQGAAIVFLSAQVRAVAAQRDALAAALGEIAERIARARKSDRPFDVYEGSPLWDALVVARDALLANGGSPPTEVLVAIVERDRIAVERR